MALIAKAERLCPHSSSVTVLAGLLGAPIQPTAPVDTGVTSVDELLGVCRPPPAPGMTFIPGRPRQILASTGR